MFFDVHTNYLCSLSKKSYAQYNVTAMCNSKRQPTLIGQFNVALLICIEKIIGMINIKTSN